MTEDAIWRGWLRHAINCPTCRFYRRATVIAAILLAASMLLG